MTEIPDFLKRLCKTCRVEKPLSHFTRHKMSKGGHLGHCKPCLAIKSAIYRKCNLEKTREVERKSKGKTYNSELQTLRKREEYRSDPEKFLRRNRSQYRKHKAKRLHSTKEYRKNNPDKVAHFRALRRSKNLQATPTWLDKEQRQHIASLYTLTRKLSRVTGEPMEVDHIVPLVNKNICGLHVPWNLQILHQNLNRTKSNKFKGDF
jgi:hypothetical protein